MRIAEMILMYAIIRLQLKEPVSSFVPQHNDAMGKTIYKTCFHGPFTKPSVLELNFIIIWSSIVKLNLPKIRVE